MENDANMNQDIEKKPTKYLGISSLNSIFYKLYLKETYMFGEANSIKIFRIISRLFEFLSFIMYSDSEWNEIKNIYLVNMSLALSVELDYTYTSYVLYSMLFNI